MANPALLAVQRVLRGFLFRLLEERKAAARRGLPPLTMTASIGAVFQVRLLIVPQFSSGVL